MKMLDVRCELADSGIEMLQEEIINNLGGNASKW